MNAPRVSPEINLGQILTAISMVGAMAVGWGMMDQRLKGLEERLTNYTDLQVTLGNHAEALKSLQSIIDRQNDNRINIARQVDEIARIKERISRLEARQ